MPHLAFHLYILGLLKQLEVETYHLIFTDLPDMRCVWMAGYTFETDRKRLSPSLLYALSNLVMSAWSRVSTEAGSVMALEGLNVHVCHLNDDGSDASPGTRKTLLEMGAK